MRRSNWTPSIVPKGSDQTVYLVVDDLGQQGRVYRETDVEPPIWKLSSSTCSKASTKTRSGSSPSIPPRNGRRMYRRKFEI